MESEGKLIEELLSMDLEPDAVRVLRKLQNAYGSHTADLKEEIIKELERESANDDNALMQVSKVRDIIMKAGENLR